MSRPRPRNNFTEPDVRSVPVVIYGLRESGDPAIRYVGRSQKPKARLSSHRSRSGSVRLAHWIRSRERAGIKIEIVELRVVPPGDDATPAELETIRELEARGEPLLNFQGLLNPPPKLYGGHDAAFVRECADLGIWWAYRWLPKKSSAA